MLEVSGVVIAVLALIASAVFYFKSTRQLRIAINVLAGYLEGTIKGADIRFNRNKKGDVVGLNITLHAEPGRIQVQVAGDVTLIKCKKDTD